MGGSNQEELVLFEVKEKKKSDNPLEGVIPAEVSDSDENENDGMTSSSEEDPDAKVNYKNSAYW